MSAERCTECGAVGDACGCASGFEPLRVRPYVTLPDPGQAAAPPPRPRQAAAPPVHPSEAAAPPAHSGQAATPSPHPADAAAPPPPSGVHTPAYGTPVASWPDETMQLRPVPAYEAPPRRRIRPLLIAASAVVAFGTAALALTAFAGSDEPETVLLDMKPSSPVISLTQVAPSQSSASAKPSPSASRSPSPSPSRSASPSASASPSPSRSSQPAPSPTPSRPSSPPPAPQAPTLRYGDSGPEVEKLQRLLASRGLYSGKFDGKYGSRTENSVSTFQWQNEIEDDDWGVYGPATRRALEG
ncbi:peptidoglycan-binding protein [Streptomyces sp. ISL-43]|uniref:peptidoglycan-binding domain-containing protein n=1 Tax=Streptomyces sp. ISL-43 TaxID=2819183 RepID=UPI001BEC40EC|nr:peptidoglycan-binding domain-containing protein [Streptomyces sp. ISL-43]MBT2449969.1 peptidoglycan-binding protein [Streptomyces sp. ISL-43]